jgi:signal transduction histidine kinase
MSMDRKTGMAVSFNFQLLLLAMLAAGVLVGWLRSRGDRDANAKRGRFRQGTWLLGFAVIAVSVIVSNTAFGGFYSPYFSDYGVRQYLLVVAAATAVVLALRPSLAQRIVPVALILLGLAGFVLARHYAVPQPILAAPAVAAPGPGGGIIRGADASVAPARTGVAEGALLTQAYLFVLLGGWLAWRSRDPVLARGRALLLGRATEISPRAQLRTLLLLPVTIMAAELFIPGGWVRAAAVSLWLAMALAAAVVVVRSWPGVAARLAVAALLFLGVFGPVLGLRYQVGYEPNLYGAVALASRQSPGIAVAEGLVVLAGGAWLVPQTFPSARRLLGLAPDVELTRQVQRLTESRAVVADTAASDLRRLERDLHDGAQARLVALGMSLRAAERLIPVNPDAALALVAEARDTSARALTELRELVRGVHPPVLADRGLCDAVRALALDCPLAVQTHVDLPGRPPAPVETACYFAVAELLTNAAKHSGARDARVDVGYVDRRLRIEVTDFGLGGADPGAGSGLAGVEKRLAAFDGIMAISSPAGGPTIVVLEVPCALSSPKTSIY